MKNFLQVTQYGKPALLDLQDIQAIIPAHECLAHACGAGIQSEIFIRGRTEPFFADESSGALISRLDKARG